MNRRSFLLPTLAVLVGLVLVSKLFSIQVLDETYKQIAEENYTQRVRTHAYRGHVLDRRGRLLAYNVPVYDLAVVPKKLRAFDTLAFCEAAGVSIDVLRKGLRDARRYSLLKPSVVIRGLDAAVFASVQGLLRDMPGFRAQVRLQRSYGHPHLAHALGYVAEITPAALAADTAGFYRTGDLRGVSGLEATYETALRGKPSLRYRVVDARGRDIGAFAEGHYDTLAVPGADLRLGLDLSLQAYAEGLMQGHSGSIVALDPRNGELLAFVSAPNYQPAWLGGQQRREHFGALRADRRRPLFNRPLQALYRPGSIFKIAQAIVALQEGAITAQTAFRCDRTLVGCHLHPSATDLRSAIRNSCNPYFYRVMQRVVQPHGNAQNPFRQARKGLQRWHERMQSLGFGQALRVDIPYVEAGSVPSVALYDRVYGPGRWKYSNIYSLSIGEGENLVVPLQMANFAAIVANAGYYYVPHFVRYIGKEPTADGFYGRRHYVGVDNKHFVVVQEAMEQVVVSGTGRRAFVPDLRIAGKTGSVENKGRPEHSVFIAYAPAEVPEIALSVYVEYMGEGGTLAASIAGLLIEKHLRGDSAQLMQEAYVRNYQPPNSYVP